MKILFGLLALVFFSAECNQQPAQLSDGVQDDVVITYEASTRGFFEKIWITKDSVSYSTDRSLKEVVNSKCKSEDWDALADLLNKVDIKSLPQLEAPTKMHQVDGAAMATLSIKMQDKIYETNVFDHGHPPKPISNLVNKVLSMKETVAKH